MEQVEGKGEVKPIGFNIMLPEHNYLQAAVKTPFNFIDWFSLVYGDNLIITGYRYDPYKKCLWADCIKTGKD